MKEKKNKIGIFMVVFMALIMVSSIFAVIFYGFSDPTAKRNYGKYRFTRLQYGYETKIDGKTQNFIYFPGDIEGINVTQETIGILKGNKFFVLTSSPKDAFNQTIAYMEYNSDKLSKDLERFEFNFAYTEDNTYRPKMTCENATSGMPVIYVSKANESSIRQEGSCVIVEGSQQDEIIAEYERLLYIIAGVMDK